MKKTLYKIENTINGFVYVGLTSKKPKARYGQHKRELRRNNHPNSLMQKDWNEFGEGVFIFSVLQSGDLSNEDEMGAVLEYQPNCYNISPPVAGFADSMRFHRQSRFAKKEKWIPTERDMEKIRKDFIEKYPNGYHE